MSRVVWFAAGAGAGVYGMIRGRRAKEAVSAGGLADRVNALGAGARALRDEVAQGSADAEIDLRRRLGLVPDGPAQLASPGSASPGSASPEEPPHQIPEQKDRKT